MNIFKCEQLLEETRVDKEKRKKVIGLANQIVEALNSAKPKGHKGNVSGDVVKKYYLIRDTTR